jgi:hypothetical protein
MSKVTKKAKVRLSLMRTDIHKRVKKLLEQDFEGYVLVTCRPATTDGQMQVEMSYEGDPILAAYLMDGAQQYLEEEDVADEEMELLS